MIYKITFSCEEGDPNFRRVFEADSEATFLDLHNAILQSVDYANDQMTSFYLCNEDWEKGQEVTLIAMDSNFDYENMVMEDTHLSDLLTEQGQRLIYVFDPMFERYFFGSLKAIEPGHIEGVVCVENTGRPPKQIKSEDPRLTNPKGGSDDMGIDEDFYGDNQFNAEDIDSEGFQDLSFEDGSMF